MIEGSLTVWQRTDKNCRNIAWATVVGAKLFNGLLWSDAVKEIEISFMNLENQICIFLSRVCSIHCALTTPGPLILLLTDPLISNTYPWSVPDFSNLERVNKLLYHLLSWTCFNLRALSALITTTLSYFSFKYPNLLYFVRFQSWFPFEWNVWYAVSSIGYRQYRMVGQVKDWG